MVIESEAVRMAYRGLGRAFQDTPPLEPTRGARHILLMALEFKSRKAQPAKPPAGTDPAARKRAASHAEQALKDAKAAKQDKREKEIGGPEGPEPTRYGDWERKGRCFDF
jgi:hypothetical protein